MATSGEIPKRPGHLAQPLAPVDNRGNLTGLDQHFEIGQPLIGPLHHFCRDKDWGNQGAP